MKYFYDTEFVSNFNCLELISVGIVAEDGREFYGINQEVNTRELAKSDWLLDNVMNSIGHELFVTSDALGFPIFRDLFITDENAYDYYTLRDQILDFFGNDDIELWASCGSFDHVVLSRFLFGEFDNHTPNWPYFTNDIHPLKEAARAARFPNEPKQESGLHNALEDARFNVARYKWATQSGDFHAGGSAWTIQNQGDNNG